MPLAIIVIDYSKAFSIHKAAAAAGADCACADAAEPSSFSISSTISMSFLPLCFPRLHLPPSRPVVVGRRLKIRQRGHKDFRSDRDVVASEEQRSSQLVVCLSVPLLSVSPGVCVFLCLPLCLYGKLLISRKNILITLRYQHGHHTGTRGHHTGTRGNYTGTHSHHTRTGEHHIKTCGHHTGTQKSYRDT